jgi:hypothetical protein
MKMAGAAGLEPVTSAVTGQRSNQLSYAPAWGRRTYEMTSGASSGTAGKVRAADAKEVGVGNPAEETSCRPNKFIVLYSEAICQVVQRTRAAVNLRVWKLPDCHLLILIRRPGGIGNPPCGNVLRNGDQFFRGQFVLENGESATERFCVKSS